MENTIANTPKSLFRDKEHYLKFIAAFKKSAQGKNLQTTHFTFYALMRNKDWRKGFAEITNKNKLNCNGLKPFHPINHGLMVLRSKLKHGTNDYQLKLAQRCLEEFNQIFGGTLTKEMMESAHNFLPMWDSTDKEYPQLYSSKVVAHV